MNIEKLKGNFFLKVKTKREELRSSILTCFRGSVAHGTYAPSSEKDSIDDIDVMSVCVAPKEFYFGLDGWGSRGTKEFWEGEWDMVCYELKKFVSLMEKSNPNVLSMLWCDKEHVIESNYGGELLRNKRMMFSTQNIYHSFCGYAHAQLEQMTRNQCLGYMGDKRRKLVEKHGYDTKNAAHLYRLLKMGGEFLDSGELNVNRANIDRDEILKIKGGGYKIEEIKEMAEGMFAEMKVKKEKCELPQHPDRKKINDLLICILEAELSV